MGAQILDGNQTAAEIRAELQQYVEQRITAGKRRPGLAVIQVGEDPASCVYVRNKTRACREVGFVSLEHKLPEATSQQELLDLVQSLNKNMDVDGILVQLPLPKHIDSDAVITHIYPEKDVDGLHPFSIGRLAQNKPVLRSCTPKGVMTLLQKTGVPLEGKEAVIVGASNMVGRPMLLELLSARCTATICHSRTKDLETHVRRAEILVVAIGRPDFIPGDWIQDGAVVIDVGINRLDNGKLTGDIDFETAKERASWITPVPGGVGPMTIASLLENTLQAAIQHD